MKKYFFLAAMAIMGTISTMSCSSDDDETIPPAPANLSTPAFAQQAADYTLTSALESTSTMGETYALQSISLCESGNVLLELRHSTSGKLSYIMEHATISGDTYTLSGPRAKGTIKFSNAVAGTRSSGHIIINISVTFSNEETVTYDTGDGSVTVTTSTPITADEAMENLARTWNVLGAIFDVKSKSKNIKAYEEFDSRSGLFYLQDVLNEALDQGISLNADEQEALQHIVKSVTLTKTGLFILSYTDHNDDVAEWYWANTEKTTIAIRLKDDSMGNKFFNDDTRIAVAFNGNRCNIKMETKLTDNSGNDWETTLILKLQE